jgi:hypothetical protein
MEYNQFMEALKGKQKKLDKNHNGELDAQDFKILRKEETEELDEIHRMKTKLNKLDPFSNRSVARQKLSNLMKSGKARGALIANKMRTLNMGDEIDAEDLDALHEVLSKDAKAGDWIHDFVHSTNPKFDGKSKKERIKMALGAYYDTNKKKDGVSEGYQSYSGRSHGNPYGGGGFGRREREDDEYHVPDPVPSRSHAPIAPVPDRKYIRGTPENKAHKAANKPINGHPTNEEVEGWKLDSSHKHPDGSRTVKVKHENGAVQVHTNKNVKALQTLLQQRYKVNFAEEVESIDEKSEQAKQNKAMKNTMDASRGARYKLNNPVPDAEPEHKTAQAHNTAIGRAMRSEDKMTTTKDSSGKLVSFKYEGDWKKSTEKKQGSGKAANLAGQAMQTMAKGQDLARARKNNMMTDEVEHIHELNDNLHPAGAALLKHIKPQHRNLYKPHLAKDTFNGSYKDRTDVLTAAKKAGHLEEAKEDPAEYDQEGDMAKTQLRSIKYHADELHEMLGDNDNLPEWVQSKLTLAQDYLQTVCDYMYSKDEVNEAAYAGLEKEDKPGKIKTAVVKLHPNGVGSDTVEGWKDPKKPVAEAVQKADIPAYLRKAKGEAPLKMHDLKRKDTISDPENLKKNRLSRITDSFDNEGNLISNKISYKDFITEIKLADLPVRRIQGHSYGANYSDPEGADDYDDKKPIKPAAEKRGRGRPAGAKSGARKITGTSKLMNK